MILGQEMFEVVEVEMRALPMTCDGNEEANEEQGQA